MKHISYKLLFGFFALHTSLITHTTPTTLMDYDPAPMYGASLYDMPPHGNMLYKRKQDMRLTREHPTHNVVGISLTPFGQKAIKATDCNGNLFGESDTEPQPAYQASMGNFRGTPFLLGLFLGNDPKGNNVWVDNQIGTDSGTIRSDLTGTSWANNSAYENSFNALKIIKVTKPNNYSIFSQDALDDDATYFTGIDLPTTYERIGARAQINVDLGKYFGGSLQAGFASIKHKIAKIGTLTTTTAPTGYNNIYNNLNSGDQPTLLNNVDLNVKNLLAAAGYTLENYQGVHPEDIHASLFVRYPIQLDTPNNAYEDWQSIIFTPYLAIEGTGAVGHKKELSSLLSLAFGNNGHHAIGGRLGGTFDFMETVEFGTEIGLMHFFEETIANMPCPTHQLQRHIYPFKTDIKVQPGINWHVRVGINAYEFIKHTDFAFSYQYVNHTKDSFKLVKANSNFMPELLEKNSSWNSHLFSAAFDFKIHPDISFGIAWQGSIKQQNARGVHTLLGSVTWLF